METLIEKPACSCQSKAQGKPMLGERKVERFYHSRIELILDILRSMTRVTPAPAHCPLHGAFGTLAGKGILILFPLSPSFSFTKTH